MLTRIQKEAFYRLAGPLLAANALVYKALRAPRQPASLKVQLGPGQKNYLPGWVNVDANMFSGKCDLWADLRNPLPFHKGTVDAFYSHHVIEHLPDLDSHFRDVFRCLKPGGVYRLGGPHGENAARKFLEGDANWFSDFPVKRKSIGGRLENFIFCRQEHLTILTPSFLEELLLAAGFSGMKFCLPKKETTRPDLFSECLALEYEDDWICPHTLIAEAFKS